MTGPTNAQMAAVAEYVLAIIEDLQATGASDAEVVAHVEGLLISQTAVDQWHRDHADRGEGVAP